jgi:hypothetical protein
MIQVCTVISVAPPVELSYGEEKMRIVAGSYRGAGHCYNGLLDNKACFRYIKNRLYSRR